MLKMCLKMFKKLIFNYLSKSAEIYYCGKIKLVALLDQWNTFCWSLEVAQKVTHFEVNMHPHHIQHLCIAIKILHV